MRAIAAALACLTLTSCGARDAYQARTALVGINVVDLESCAGIPLRTKQVSPSDWLLNYEFKGSGPAFSIKILTDIDAQIGSIGGCELTIRAREPGYVLAVHYTGTSFSTEGPNAACGPLVSECTKRADRTTLPAGYSMAKWLGDQKK